jgi:hypothetical protein
MAKKTPKRTASVKSTQPWGWAPAEGQGTAARQVPEGSCSFDEMFPTITRWISQEEGWVELGADHYSRSLARAMYGGGMVWEGTDKFGSLDEALRAMEDGIASWLAEVRPSQRTGGKVNRVKGGSRRRAGAKAREPARSASSGRSVPRKRSSPVPSKRPEPDDRVEADAAPTVPRPIIEKVRKFAEIAKALRRGEHFEITRLTSIKGLCKEPGAAWSFALFLAVHARKRAEQKNAAKRVKELMAMAIPEMEAYLDNPTTERKERLYPLLREIAQEQDEHKRIKWNVVRIVHSMELLVVEKTLRSIVQDHEAPAWLYHAARDYAERYDPRYGTGLIPASAPMMREIADFWRDYFSIGR